MYIVQWDDWEGKRNERAFTKLSDAKLEAADLREKYDYVEIVKSTERTGK